MAVPESCVETVDASYACIMICNHDGKYNLNEEVILITIELGLGLQIP